MIKLVSGSLSKDLCILSWVCRNRKQKFFNHRGFYKVTGGLGEIQKCRTADLFRAKSLKGISMPSSYQVHQARGVRSKRLWSLHIELIARKFAWCDHFLLHCRTSHQIDINTSVFKVKVSYTSFGQGSNYETTIWRPKRLLILRPLGHHAQFLKWRTCLSLFTVVPRIPRFNITLMEEQKAFIVLVFKRSSLLTHLIRSCTSTAR